LTALRARAAPFESEFPYGVVRQLFEPVVTQRVLAGEDLFAGAAMTARAVFDDLPGPRVRLDSSFASLHALYWLTANIASQAPVLVSVDDVIYCDEASLRFLEFLVRRLEGMPVMVAMAYRTGEPGSQGAIDAFTSGVLAEVITPAPLGEAALTTMLAAGLGEDVGPEFCAACLDATGGNPLLVAELVRALHAGQVRPGAAEAARVRELGAIAVGPAVRRRLELLGGRAQAVAQAVAVLGESARRDDLAGTAGLPPMELDEVLAALQSAAIVHANEQVSFVHPLVAEAVRASLTAIENARLHQRAIAALSERRASSWELAPHVMACPRRAHPGAERLLREAAQWALAAGVPDAAVVYLARAAAELDLGDDPAPLLLELGNAKVQAGDPSARADLGRAIELARDVRTRASARMALSVVLFAAGEAVRSIQTLDEGLDEVAAEDPELAERMEGHLLSNIVSVGPSLVMFPRRVGERMERARSAHKPRDTVAGRMVLCALAYEEMIGGGAAADVVQLADQALANDELLHADGPGSTPMLRAMVALLMCDELERAAAAFTRAMAEARRLASPPAFAWASAWRSFANSRLGRLVDAEADAHAGLESGDQHLSGYGLTLSRLWLALSLTEQGRLDEAGEVLRHIPDPDPPSLVTYAVVEARARFHLAGGKYESLAQDYQLCRRLDEHTASLVDWRRPATGLINYRTLGARALIGLGDLDGARALLDEEMPLAKAFGTHRAVGMALHAAGLLARGDARIETLQHAAEELAQSQSRLEYARVLCDYGTALRHANRRFEARAPLRTALAIARDARAQPLRDRVAQELQASGVRVSRPGLTGVDALTASEYRIASMAASGTSNREIAQALFVTVKTVETHLGHVYDKLDLTRRAQLAGVLDAT
jgi:DNA-binding CsgD family transcriptional regulator